MKRVILSALLAVFGMVYSVSAQEKVWEGAWETNKGTMQLYQKGEIVYGDIDSGVSFQGIYDERKDQLIGVLQEGEVSKKLRLIRNGKSFSGELIGGKDATKEVLKGRRVATKPARKTNQKWTGNWEADKKKITLDEENSLIKDDTKRAVKLTPATPNTKIKMTH